MRNAASRIMWIERARNAPTFAMAIMAALAMSLLLLAVASRPAEAAFPGANGKIVFASNRAAPDGSTDYEIYVMNADGMGVTQLTNNRADDREPAFSDDGSRITFERTVSPTARDIWVMNADGSEQVQLTAGYDPTFSPDGYKIAFANRGDIFVVDADGSAPPTNLTNDSLVNRSPAWSPGGSKIAFATKDTENCNQHTCLYVKAADGSGVATQLTEPTNLPIEGWGPAWSSDGSKIAFHWDDSSDGDIYVANSGGGYPLSLFDLVPGSITEKFDSKCQCMLISGTDSGYQADPAFSPDGLKLAFRRDDDIWVGRIDGRGPNLDGSWTPTRLTSGAAVDTDPDWGVLSHDLSVTQTDSPDPVKVNNNLTYTLKVKNEGYDAAPGVVLTDRLPSGVTYISASTGCSHAAGKVTCKLGSVMGVTSTRPTGTTVTKTITVKPTTQDTITNTASVKSSAQEVTYTANNTDKERTQVTLNRAPVANADSYVTDEDTPLTVAAPGVLENDTDADYDSLTVAAVVKTTSNGTLTHNANGSFTYTPKKNFNGTDAFTYKATDGTVQSNVATVSIVVSAVNDAPNAQDDSAQTETNTPLDINVLSNDRDPEQDEISITEVSDPANGTATLNTDGTVRYAPDTDLFGMPGNHYLGPDSFTYTVSDGNGATDTATVNIQVKDTVAPEAPVITSPANNTTSTDGSFTISGTSEPGTSVKIFEGGNRAQGVSSVTGSADGYWSWEFWNVSEGTHTYTVKATDRAGNTSEAATVTVIVDIP